MVTRCPFGFFAGFWILILGYYVCAQTDISKASDTIDNVKAKIQDKEGAAALFFFLCLVLVFVWLNTKSCV